MFVPPFMGRPGRLLLLLCCAAACHLCILAGAGCQGTAGRRATIRWRRPGDPNAGRGWQHRRKSVVSQKNSSWSRGSSCSFGLSSADGETRNEVHPVASLRNRIQELCHVLSVRTLRAQQNASLSLGRSKGCNSLSLSPGHLPAKATSICQSCNDNCIALHREGTARG